ncbi:MAG: type I-D CRISPR-associated helicase Cas3' [Thermotoga caldifontis]|uniref:type I-D CRISPR-associated helicase Cas3' n=1 Tax=Thermotoga caldifontis TaxID=1508419 RepID=UPI003C7EA5F3
MGYSVPVLEEDGRTWVDHQVRTYRELENSDVVINVYPTGTGKTLAVLNAIRKLNIDRVLIIAPVNELINQYEATVERFVQEHRLGHRVFLVTSQSLEEMDSSSHSRALRSILSAERAIAITNPDIVFYVLLQRYGARARSGDLLVKLFKFPQLVVFDEFHVYDPGRLFFAFALIATSRYFNLRQKYIFMTATPSRYVDNAFTKLGLRVSRIGLEENSSQDFKPAASPVYVELVRGSGKLDGHMDLILQIVKEHADKDILIVSDSLSRLAKLAHYLRSNGIEFGMVTGPMSRGERITALRKRLILATTTIDVGYEISRPEKDRQGLDVVIFEASTAEDIVQRLGRVGRVLGKNRTDVPAYAYMFVPARIFSAVQKILEESNDRLGFARSVQSKLSLSVENLKREYLGPQGLVLAFYEDFFTLLFPKDYKDLLREYFQLLESLFGLERNFLSRHSRRIELDFYYFAKSLLDEECESAEHVLERSPQLREKIRTTYQDDELCGACAVYRKFVEKLILSFRSEFTQKVYVVDPKKFCGTERFVYDKFFVLTRYRVRKLGKSVIPVDMRGIVNEAYELLEPLEKPEKVHLSIVTRSEKKFFIPTKVESQMFDMKALELDGLPVYRLSPEEESECFFMDLAVREAEINGWKEKVVIGTDAIKAVSYLSEKPWECDLFPQ